MHMYVKSAHKQNFTLLVFLLLRIVASHDCASQMLSPLPSDFGVLVTLVTFHDSNNSRWQTFLVGGCKPLEKSIRQF